MTEPDVALTDYGLAVECAIFAWLVYRRGARGSALHFWVVVFFASLALASLCGGTVHGFFLDEASYGNAVLWPLSLLAIGATALAGWAIGAKLTLARGVARWVLRAASLQLVVYGAIVLLVSDAFWVAIVCYLPAALFLLVAFVLAARRPGMESAWFGAVGLILTFAAAAFQQLHISVHPVYFNHNALYHTVQAVALGLIFVGYRDPLVAGVGFREDDSSR
jgi:hypothetical protein